MNSLLTRRGFLVGTAILADRLARGSEENEDSALHSTATDVQKSSGQPVPHSQVRIQDSFWSPKTEKIATKTLPACIVQTELKSGRIRNFERVARNQGEPHEGMVYDDSDVYKAIEAMAYSLSTHPDKRLEAKADEWIAKIAAAQRADGYLNTYYTLTGLDKRWTDMGMHEDYCAGHLIEAAVAYHGTTGKRELLDVAIRFADYLDSTFRVPNRHWVTGHEEIELALMRLYRLTNEKRYVRLAQWYLEQRGRGFGKGELWNVGLAPDYCQDAIPVKEQRKIAGHAVRAMYLYSGTTDVAAATGDPGYLYTLRTLWEDVVYRKMYVTGGIGSSAENEGFTANYDLPNERAYCETCASVGMVFWNHRMALLTGESQYMDVLERTLYNGALDGLGLGGDRFFYGNPLASRGGSGETGRSEWFGTACCPSNIARLVSSVGGYFYAASDHNVWINLFASSEARFRIGQSDIAVRVTTQYPWSGDVRVMLDPPQPTRLKLHVRIPGWARAVAVPGDLYRFADVDIKPVELRLNGRPVTYKDEKGYAVMDREWRSGDVVELVLPMPVRQLVARQEVRENRDRVAFQRGPIVYCLEGTDNIGGVANFLIKRSAFVATQTNKVVDEDVVTLHGDGSILTPTADGMSVERKPQTMVAIPYYTWANRGNYDMQVWLPYRISDVSIGS